MFWWPVHAICELPYHEESEGPPTIPKQQLQDEASHPQHVPNTTKGRVTSLGVCSCIRASRAGSASAGVPRRTVGSCPRSESAILPKRHRNSTRGYGLVRKLNGALNVVPFLCVMKNRTTWSSKKIRKGCMRCCRFAISVRQVSI